MRPRRNGRHLADDIFNSISLNKNIWIPIKISLKFVPRDPINNIPALVQIMAWRRRGDKPLSEPMMDSLPTHICVTRPQWVKLLWNAYYHLTVCSKVLLFVVNYVHSCIVHTHSYSILNISLLMCRVFGIIGYTRYVLHNIYICDVKNILVKYTWMYIINIHLQRLCLSFIRYLSYKLASLCVYSKLCNELCNGNYDLVSYL